MTPGRTRAAQHWDRKPNLYCHKHCLCQLAGCTVPQIMHFNDFNAAGKFLFHCLLSGNATADWIAEEVFSKSLLNLRRNFLNTFLTVLPKLLKQLHRCKLCMHVSFTFDRNLLRIVSCESQHFWLTFWTTLMHMNWRTFTVLKILFKCWSMHLFGKRGRLHRSRGSNGRSSPYFLHLSSVLILFLSD